MFTSKPYDIACNILPFAARLLPLPLLKRVVRIHTAGLGSSLLPSFLHPSEHRAPAKCYWWRQHYAEGKICILHSAQLSRAKWLIKSPGHQLKRGERKGLVLWVELGREGGWRGGLRRGTCQSLSWSQCQSRYTAWAALPPKCVFISAKCLTSV